ncbi:class I SAM-dependent methyltransferase [Bradyrhizobium sp. JYMT SZCCT0428]|uniref:class I SAM-dependent methyltransferase n=1 Tax=Bradyrhizobium sp. JYMT SZCCT0428 TaxID=2807673 RepID=UPI001BADBA64|nr:class I SAM-dependent methyltransferase [Bradyrhizobium sp. JYMT SZCCT0428]MBR1151579.1 methyltransferase domain-containing protein [Bradyrhizobium sp. JYMT SZCCT0428]
MSIVDRVFGASIPRNSSRARLNIEMERFAAAVAGNALVLDAGAGSHPYKTFFKHAKYESADFEEFDGVNGKTTYVCDLTSIPVEGDRFDYVIFIQVMEHVPQPALVLKELFRVLKPGGKLLYTGPLYYEEHLQPYDFYRYTQFGLKFLFSGAGFSVDRLDWLEGYFGTAAYQLNSIWRHLPSKPSDIGGGFFGFFLSPFLMVLRLESAALSIFFHWLEMKRKVTQKGYPKNYVAILSKP